MSNEVDSYFRKQRQDEYTKSKDKRSKEERDADFFWEGQEMMDDIDFGDLGGAGD